MNTILPAISTSFIVLSAIFVAFGWRDIRNKQMQQHMQKMVIGAICAVLFFLIYATRTVIVGNTAFGGPDWIKPFYFTFLIFHISLALFSAVLGIITLVLAYKKNFSKHRKIGPITATCWLFTAITGVTVYLLLYIIYVPGPTKNVFHIITNVSQ